MKRKMEMYNEAEGLNEDGLVLSEAYRKTMEERVLPELKRVRRDFFAEGDGGRSLFCSVFSAPRPRGTVVLVHGFTENADKFDEVIYSLLMNGYSVCAYDQRGHGRSWRPEGLPDASVTHVDAFSEYVRDLDCIFTRVVSGMPGPILLFGHSMGGAVCARFLEEYPGRVCRAVLSSPMIACTRGGLPLFLSEMICRIPSALGKGKKRSFFSRPYAGPEKFDTSCATGRERFDWYDRIRVSTPEFQNSGPTYRWTLEALKVTRVILAPGNVEKVDVPVLVFTAENDSMVLPGPQMEFTARLRNGENRVVKNARHEIYRSEDRVLFPWWHEVLAFLDGGKNDAPEK